MKKITSKLLNKIFFLMAVGLSIGILFFVIGVAWIGYEAKNQCERAKLAYEGDCVEALISLLNDTNRSFRERNDAIWTLGQLGDSRALPVLETYYTGNILDREPLNETISQYELRKAVNLTSGGTNIIGWMWRDGVMAQ